MGARYLTIKNTLHEFIIEPIIDSIALEFLFSDFEKCYINRYKSFYMDQVIRKGDLCATIEFGEYGYFFLDKKKFKKRVIDYSTDKNCYQYDGKPLKEYKPSCCSCRLLLCDHNKDKEISI